MLVRAIESARSVRARIAPLSSTWHASQAAACRDRYTLAAMSHHLMRRIQWAALLALLWATLAPSIAHGLRHARGERMPWSTVCNATGARRVVFELPANDAKATAATHAFDHCAYCALHHDGCAPPVAGTTAPLRNDLDGVALPAVARAMAPHRVWPAAPARAPPPLA
jgi:hypothetical protein